MVFGRAASPSTQRSRPEPPCHPTRILEVSSTNVPTVSRDPVILSGRRCTWDLLPVDIGVERPGTMT